MRQNYRRIGLGSDTTPYDGGGSDSSGGSDGSSYNYSSEYVCTEAKPWIPLLIGVAGGAVITMLLGGDNRKRER